MNGLQVLDLKRPGLADRLLRRRPKQNAALELNNYVAVTPLPQVERAAIEEILSRYGLDISDARPAFAMIYTQVLRYFSEDRAVSADEQEQLSHVRGMFGLTDEEILTIRNEVLLPVYRAAVESSYEDGHLTPKEREGVERLARELGLAEAEAEVIAFDEAYRAFEEAMGKRSPAVAKEEKAES